MDIVRVLAFIAGLIIVFIMLGSAIRAFVLPRNARDFVTTVVFRGVFIIMTPWVRMTRPYRLRDRAAAVFVPVGLLVLPIVWLTVVAAGYTLMYWAVGIDNWSEALTLSGSSILTLGFAVPKDMTMTIMAFSEATIGLILVALLIAYIPTMYSAFSRRELVVTSLLSRAGSPATAYHMLGRFHSYASLSLLDDLWAEWENWFHDIEESHTSLAPLPFFRSPKPDRSWVLAACILLDTVALVISTLDVPRNPRAGFCMREGWMTLRYIASFFGLPYNENPASTDPISITKAQFDEAYDHLAQLGVPLKPDRELAWRDFAGWRVNYDSVIMVLAQLTMAPDAPWMPEKSRRRVTIGKQRLVKEKELFKKW